MTRLTNTGYGKALLTLCLLSYHSHCAAEHVHDNHPATVHNGYYQRVSLEEGTTFFPAVQLQSDEWVLMVDAVRWNNTCSGDYTVSLNEAYTYQDMIEVGVDVQGHYKAEYAAGILWNGIKSELGIQVTFSGNYSWSHEYSLSATDTFSIPPCGKRRFTLWKNNKLATGTIDYWDHRITCQHTQTAAQSINYCNRLTLSGK